MTGPSVYCLDSSAGGGVVWHNVGDSNVQLLCKGRHALPYGRNTNKSNPKRVDGEGGVGRCVHAQESQSHTAVDATTVPSGKVMERRGLLESRKPVSTVT